jgi:hypothetical protein
VSVGRGHHAFSIASARELRPRSMSASGRTGRNGIESDFRFWPVAEATAARHCGRFLGSTCRGLARMTLARCAPSYDLPLARRLHVGADRGRAASVVRSSCGVMADSYHALSSRSMRLHLALRYRRQCRNMRHCRLGRFELRCAKGPGPLGAPLDEGACDQQAIQPLPRRLFSLEAQRSAPACANPNLYDISKR